MTPDRKERKGRKVRESKRRLDDKLKQGEER
jgi:hypothetical protein